MDKSAENAPPPAYPPGGQYPDPNAAYPPPQGNQPPPQGYQPPPPGYGGQPPAYGQPGAPPPAPGYAQQPGATVVIHQPQQMFREAPVVMACPHCRANITTSLTYENGTITWLAAGGLCFIGCWLGCCLIPLCVDSLKDVKHYCPNCNKMVGSYNRM